MKKITVYTKRDVENFFKDKHHSSADLTFCTTDDSRFIVVEEEYEIRGRGAEFKKEEQV